MKMHLKKPDEETLIDICKWACVVLAAVAFWAAANSCSADRKLLRAEKKITRIAVKVPGSIIKPCNTFLPPLISSDSTKTVFLPGEVVKSHDTTTKFDTVTNKYTITITNTLFKTDTLVVTRNVVTVDNKRVQLLERQLNDEHEARLKAESKADQLAKTKKTLWLVLGGIGLLAIIGIVIKIYGSKFGNVIKTVV